MIDYIGEHTFAGQLGNFFVVLAFVAALFSGVAYYFSYRYKEAYHSFRRLARGGFYIHSAAVFGMIATLFVMLLNQYFEYNYVWTHSNTTMPLQFIFSCFWEGQEGSFMLWIFWHVVIGNILMRTSKNWESLVMMVFCMVQVFLGTMLLGIYVFGHKIGSSPFLLIRELPENIGLPWTFMPDYLEKIPAFQDGRGLNPTLQNYWMTIHPPTLFLGFATTLVPFAYACAGLIKGQLRDWIKPAIPWAFFGVAVLGLGILMGGAWAYESLSFGGFWAWDPVENASLVPWLTLVGAAHVMVVNQRKGTSLFTTFFLSLISFILVLYSTFLTRSGVLGDTSVHSFTGEGMIGMLLIFLLFFTAFAFTLLLINKRLKSIYIASSLLLLVAAFFTDQYTALVVTFLLVSAVLLIIGYNKAFPTAREEEKLWSREFWLFTGALVLLLSAMQLTFETSKPVWNLIAEPFSGPLMWLYETTGIEGFQSLATGKLAPHSDVITHFNKWQTPFAFIVCFLIAIGQFLRYKNTEFRVFAKKISLSLIISIAITIPVAILLGFTFSHTALILLLFTSIFAAVANADYFFRILRGKMDQAGASMAHVGFGLLMLGALISMSKQNKISENATPGIELSKLSEDFSNQEDILLFEADTVPMGDYFVSFRGKYTEGLRYFYKVDYFEPTPRTYKAGDMVIARGAVFRALDDHQPGPDFILDQQHWQMVDDPRSLDVSTLQRWSPNRAGEHLFTLEPTILKNPEFGNVAEPATRHYLDRDLYTHLRWAELDSTMDENGYTEAEEYQLAVGDTLFLDNTMIRLNALALVQPDQREQYMVGENDLAIRAVLGVQDEKGERYVAEPLFILRDSSLIVPDPVIQDETGLKITFDKIDPKSEKHTFTIAQYVGDRKEFIVMRAVVFPMINILWVGCILMVLGSLMAVRHRYKLLKRKKS